MMNIYVELSGLVPLVRAHREATACIADMRRSLGFEFPESPSWSTPFALARFETRLSASIHDLAAGHHEVAVALELAWARYTALES